MTLLQFSLFFAALLIGYVLLHMRLARFEVFLREIKGLKALNERLKSMADAMQHVRVDRIEDHLEQIHAEFGALREGLSAVSQRLSPGNGTEAAIELAEPAGIRGAVETRLLALGYHDLHVLSDLSGARLEDELEILVECRRDDMQHKGRVRTRNGAILDVSLQSVAQSFP